MIIIKEGKHLWINGKKIKINSIVGFNTASSDDEFMVHIYYKNWLGFASKIEMNFWKKEGMISCYDRISHLLAMEGIY
jgi:hypothetical protein